MEHWEIVRMIEKQGELIANLQEQIRLLETRLDLRSAHDYGHPETVGANPFD